jgi:hypothetical protein
MLEATEMNTLRKIVGKIKADLVRNQAIGEQRKVQPIES